MTELKRKKEKEKKMCLIEMPLNASSSWFIVIKKKHCLERAFLLPPAYSSYEMNWNERQFHCEQNRNWIHILKWTFSMTIWRLPWMSLEKCFDFYFLLRYSFCSMFLFLLLLLHSLVSDRNFICRPILCSITKDVYTMSVPRRRMECDVSAAHKSLR